MKTRTAVVAALLAVGTLGLTACGSDDKADPAACKAAVAEQVSEAVKSGKEMGEDRPSACDGLSEKELDKIAREVASKEIEDSLGDLQESLDELEQSAP
ncbi:MULTISPECIES: hypothetical protein [Streptomyces]|uniref:Secreted protein n=1 Tax=Streptomyces fuscus TaxID=3048495 RepID=A0ABT7JAS6_9ACTN|nr:MULTISPECIES: hypothetical protein [Streptomyces]MCM1975251.1 hypothetical protein [Streptomyces sp. G1]MDL2081985.1 hypothetical protein [Streptomyces fuscus]SBT94263.1 hypothetical protein GA0115233_108317 [Streptomyces sp. DI166]